MNPLRLCYDRPTSLYGKIEYIINGKRGSSGTFSPGDKVLINLSVPRVLGISDATLILNSDGEEEKSLVAGCWKNSSRDADVYSFNLDVLRLNVGLYFFTARFKTVVGELYAIPSYDEVRFTENQPREGFQITVSDFKYDDNSFCHGGVIYHIFVDRFKSSGRFPPKDGAVLVKDWATVAEYPEYPGAHMKNNSFYGGDLKGIESELPYLSSLGVKIIYLSPIFEAKSNHKYDTADYMSVDSMFGGEAALKSLIKKSKKLGISIILDGVFNHTGDDSIYFNRYANYPSIGAYQSRDSEYYSWYDFKSYPDKYTAWWGIEILPRINPDNPTCRSFFTGNEGVISKYSRLGVDGFRLDVIDELSDDFVSDIKRVLSENNSRSILYGEVWEDPSNKIAYGKRKQYYRGSEIDGAMNYPLRRGIIDFLKSERTDTLRYALTSVLNNAPERIRNTMMNILGTHDTERILTVLAGESSYGKSNMYLSKARMSDKEREIGKAMLKTAYTVLATLPGLPTIFYGDEAGLEGYGDPFNRMPYPWGREEGDLIEHYQRLGEIRKTHNVYKRGEFRLHILDDNILVFSRRYKSYNYLTIVNNSSFDMHLRDNGGIEIILGESTVINPKTAIIIKTKLDKVQIYRQ